MIRRVALAALAIAGVAAGVAVAGSPTTHVLSVCARATLPAQTIAVNGAPVATVPAVSKRACATRTYTVPTVTETTTDTVTTSATVTTTAPLPATTTATVTTTTVTTPTPPPPPSSGTANAWVGNPGACVATATAAAYDATTSCSTATAAVAALKAVSPIGGLIRARCGDYFNKESFTTTGFTGMVTLTSETGRCAKFDNQSGSVEMLIGPNVSYLTFDHLTIGGMVAYSSQSGASNDQDAVTNNDIDVAHQINGPAVSYSVGTGFWFVGNTVGPSLHSDVAACTPNCGSNEGVRIGKPNTAVASCKTQACDVTIDDNTIQYVTRNVAYWPSSGFGPPQGGTCTNADGCHIDAIHIWGIDGGDISRNRIIGDECQGIFIENTNASLQENVAIVGNDVGALASGCGNKGIYLSAGGTAHAGAGFAGTWLIAFNSGGGTLIGANGCGSCQPGTVFHFVGNDMPQFLTNATGNGAGCGSGSFGTATVTFDDNVWRSGQTCGATDTLAVPAYINSAAAPAVGIDLHLLAPPAPSIPCATVPGGCPAHDLEGTPFGALAIPGALQR